MDDRWVGFPLRPADLARSLPPATIARIGAEAMTAPLRRRDVTSYADALRRGLGPTLYNRLYGAYAVKLWGRPGEDIDAEQARVRGRRTGREDRRPDAAPPEGGTGKVFHYRAADSGRSWTPLPTRPSTTA